MSKLDAVLTGKTSVGIAGHVRPDGDCVGSTLAVYNYIRLYYQKISFGNGSGTPSGTDSKHF